MIQRALHPRNLPKGFGRFKPREIATFTRIARGSLIETMNHLLEAEKCQYIGDEEPAIMLRLNRRALKATTRLLTFVGGRKRGILSGC